MSTTAYWIERDAVRVSGPDAESFLQGQLSQDVTSIQPRQSMWSLLLQPQGKVDAFVRVTRVADDDFVLDTDGGWGQRVVDRLSRFKLRVKADIELLADWKCLAIRHSDGTAGPVEPPPGTVVATMDWPGFEGRDLLGPDPFPPVPAPLEIGDVAEYERRRIEAGFPVMGRELDERTIPAEAGVVARSVSFTKGCYTGQELVARIDSRGGNVPRHLRLVRIAGVLPPAGAAVVSGGKEVGTVTSVAATGDGGAVALAYLGRSVVVPADIELVWDGAPPVAATAEALPA